MKKHVKIVPQEPTYIGRRKLLYYICEENDEDVKIRNERLKNQAKNNQIPIIRVSGSGTMKYFDSIREASLASNISESSISKCINKKQASAGGYVFKREKLA